MVSYKRSFLRFILLTPLYLGAIILIRTSAALIGETMIPEGLEFNSVDEILDKVESVGFNFIRM